MPLAEQKKMMTEEWALIGYHGNPCYWQSFSSVGHQICDDSVLARVDNEKSLQDLCDKGEDIHEIIARLSLMVK